MACYSWQRAKELEGDIALVYSKGVLVYGIFRVVASRERGKVNGGLSEHKLGGGSGALSRPHSDFGLRDSEGRKHTLYAVTRTSR
jgi:hypothetical protein